MLQTLRARMMLIIAAALLPAGWLIAHEFTNHRQEALEGAKSLARHHRDQLLASYQQDLKATRQLLAALSRLPAIRQQHEEASALLAALKAEHPIYQNLFANRADGSLFASAEPATHKVNAAKTAWFQAAAAADGFTIGEYLRGKITGRRVLTLAYPVRADDGRLLATVGASLPTDWFAAALTSGSFPGPASVAIFEASGRTLASFGEHPLAGEEVVRQLTGDTTLWQEHGEQTWVYAIAPLVRTAGGTRTFFAFGLGADAILHDAGSDFRNHFLAWFTVAVLALGGAWFASRIFVEVPVRRLLETTARLRAGDLSARSHIRRAPRELTELGERFDAMARDLEQREADLRRSQEALQATARENAFRRREAERQSESYQRDLHAIMQRMQDVVFRLDGEGIVTWVTPSIESLTGYRPAEIVGRDACLCMADPEDKQRLLHSLEAGGGRIRDWEVELRHKDGTQLHASINAHCIRSGSGAVIGIEGVARDITDQMRARDELIELSRVLEERVQERTAALERTNTELEAFTYSVSHDLRAPLRSIEGFAKLVLMRYRERMPEQGQDYLERVQRAAQRMAQLIDDLLSLSRLNRFELQREEVDVSALSREILDGLQSENPDRRVEWSIEPGIRCWCDRQLCRIALENLLGNAWKYTGTRKTARIALSTVDDGEGQPTIRIADNGVGFDMQYADKLFMPFQRLHSTEQFEGTGIGLATVMRIVQRHGGEVRAESHLGEGATFYIRFGNAKTSNPEPETAE